MAKKKTQQDAISPAEIERAIHLFRGQRVMLDSDVADAENGRGRSPSKVLRCCPASYGRQQL
jgi:hypothetical protein